MIADSLNYIKGYRYELYCLSKHTKTTQCVLHCDTTPDDASMWNSARAESEQYTPDVFDALVARYETPDSRNRWDSPLFLVLPSDPLPGEGLMGVLLHRRPAPPNLSTQSQPLSSADFLHVLDRQTQAVVSLILQTQRMTVAGDNPLISCGPTPREKLRLPRHVTMAELRQLRRQFINYTKLHPPEDSSMVTHLFVQYLTSSL